MTGLRYYDFIARKYDRMYAGPECVAENKVLRRVLGQLGFWRPGVSVLDLGCGTGLFLDLMCQVGAQLRPDLYVGFDLSERMLAVARRKHPRYIHSFMKEDMLGPSPFGPFTHVVCLFAGYYVQPALLAERIRHLLRNGGTFLLTLPTRRKAASEGATWGLDKQFDVNTYWHTPQKVRALYGRSAHVRGLSFWAKRLPRAMGTALEFKTIGKLWPGGGDYLVVWGTV
jgi:SAM-dependent methyltransferase